MKRIVYQFVIPLLLVLTIVFGQGLALANIDCHCLENASSITQFSGQQHQANMPCCDESSEQGKEKTLPCQCEIKSVPNNLDASQAILSNAHLQLIGTVNINFASLLYVSWKENPTNTYQLFYPDKRKSYLAHQRLLI